MFAKIFHFLHFFIVFLYSFLVYLKDFKSIEKIFFWKSEFQYFNFLVYNNFIKQQQQKEHHKIDNIKKREKTIECDRSITYII